MMNDKAEFATKEQQFNMLYGSLKEHFSGLIDFEFKQISALIIAISWFVTSEAARNFIRGNLTFKVAMTVFAFLLTFAHADWVENFYQRSENAYRHLISLNYIPEAYYVNFRFRRIMIRGCKLVHIGLVTLFSILIWST